MKFCTIIFFSPPHPASLVPCAAPAFVSPPLPSEDEQNTTTTCRARAHFSSSPRLPAAAAAHNPVLPAPCLVLPALAHTLSSIWGLHTPNRTLVLLHLQTGCWGVRVLRIQGCSCELPTSKEPGLVGHTARRSAFQKPTVSFALVQESKRQPKILA